jgi:hypothetical protein
MPPASPGGVPGIHLAISGQVGSDQAAFLMLIIGTCCTVVGSRKLRFLHHRTGGMVAALIILRASGPLIVSRRINSAANVSTAGHTCRSDKWSRVATNSHLSHAEHCSLEPQISIAMLTA